jgi:hypothetical protein
MVFIAFVIGLAAGAAALYWRTRDLEKKKRRIPREWPLKTRPLVNSAERRVWLWLAKVMFDQQILIKMPVTRFTSPANTDDAENWYQLLNGVYCTFTLCNMDGKVIGCVDVPGRKGLSMTNQTLKHGLLAHCGLPYWVVDPSNLPHLTQIRTAFLGEQAVKGEQRVHLASQVKDVAVHLQAVVNRQREGKSSNFTRLEAELADETIIDESQLPEGWEQNSFVTPLDSRSAAL